MRAGLPHERYHFLFVPFLIVKLRKPGRQAGAVRVLAIEGRARFSHIARNDRPGCGIGDAVLFFEKTGDCLHGLRGFGRSGNRRYWALTMARKTPISAATVSGELARATGSVRVRRAAAGRQEAKTSNSRAPTQTGALIAASRSRRG